MSYIIQDLYQTSKKKKLFSYVHKTLAKDHCGVPTLLKNGVEYDESQAKASILNQ